MLRAVQEAMLMAVTKIAYKPGLTAEQALEAFKKQFQGKYEVEPWVRPGLAVAAPKRDFVIKKNAFAGVSVKLEQGEGETKFVYTGYAPNQLAGTLVYLGGGVILSYLVWNSLTREVQSFIESAPEFK